MERRKKILGFDEVLVRTGTYEVITDIELVWVDRWLYLASTLFYLFLIKSGLHILSPFRKLFLNFSWILSNRSLEYAPIIPSMKNINCKYYQAWPEIHFLKLNIIDYRFFPSFTQSSLYFHDFSVTTFAKFPSIPFSSILSPFHPFENSQHLTSLLLF